MNLSAPSLRALLLAALLAPVVLLPGCNSDGAAVGARPMAGLETGEPAAGGYAADEELWVIARPGEVHAERARGRVDLRGLGSPDLPDVPDAVPGTGGLIVHDASTGRDVVVPLTHTEVLARIAGDAATVRVEQRFENPWTTKIEAVYVFPLPTDAAVHEFVMTIGERRIRGIIRDREEAEQLYQEARAAGHVASLLTQERPNVFTQKVANIEPGKTIDIEIDYLHSLPWRDGEYEFVFPMVVGPRFNPPGTLAEGKGLVAVARGAGAAGNQSVPYLAPNERSGHDIMLTVELDAGLPIEALRCETHRVDVEQPEASRARVALDALDTIPNKDFVLRWSVAGDRTRAAFLADSTDEEGAFVLTIYPPAEQAAGPREPLEMVFVVDCSGSMSGAPLGLARDAIHEGLRRLDAGDTFQVIRFSNDDSRLSAGTRPATAHDLREGRRYVDGLEASGGTMMLRGVQAALRLREDPERQRIVVFLTDGYIGNEEEVLGEVRNHVGRTRIFSFGIGSSPNRFLLERMASEGRGAVAYVSQGSNAAEVMGQFFDRVSRPALTDLRIEWNGITVREVLPSRIPDVFVGRPITLRGRFDRNESIEPGALRIRGRIAGRETSIDVPLRSGALAERHATLPRLWARAKIADLLSGARVAGADRVDVAGSVRSLALEYGLMSPWTAFVAVDSSAVTAGDHGVTVPVALEVPEGVRYETTVSGTGGERR